MNYFNPQNNPRRKLRCRDVKFLLRVTKVENGKVSVETQVVCPQNLHSDLLPRLLL